MSEVCTGCGTTMTLEDIRLKHPTAISCCPERDMIPVQALFVQLTSAKRKIKTMLRSEDAGTALVVAENKRLKHALKAASVLLETIEQDADMALMDEWDRGDDGFNCMIDLIREWREKHDIPLEVLFQYSNETTSGSENK